MMDGIEEVKLEHVAMLALEYAATIHDKTWGALMSACIVYLPQAWSQLQAGLLVGVVSGRAVVVWRIFDATAAFNLLLEKHRGPATDSDRLSTWKQ